MAQGGPGHYFYLYGDAGDDIIKFTCGEAHGGDGADTIEGMAGPIFGDAGNDTLKGNSGTDTIHGGADNDTINGKADADILYGDAGIDTFIFEHGTGSDTIKDFVHGTDKIDLTDYHFTSFAALLAAMGESAGSAFINLGSGDLVVFEGVALASLDAGDFLL